MASLALLGGNHHPDNLMNGTTTCFLVATTNSGGTHLTDISSPSISRSPSQSIPPQNIAPKLPGQYSNKYAGADLLRCKRRIQLGHLPSSGKSSNPQPAAVARRNERERNRVRLVNLGFATLRQHVPNSSKSKKMSKVDTLRSAVEYIKRLQELLGETSSGVALDENSYPGQSSTGSPTPSFCSDASSPYDGMQEDDELMDFASWF